MSLPARARTAASWTGLRERVASAFRRKLADAAVLRLLRSLAGRVHSAPVLLRCFRCWSPRPARPAGVPPACGFARTWIQGSGGGRFPWLMHRRHVLARLMSGDADLARAHPHRHSPRFPPPPFRERSPTRAACSRGPASPPAKSRAASRTKRRPRSTAASRWPGCGRDGTRSRLPYPNTSPQRKPSRSWSARP